METTPLGVPLLHPAEYHPESYASFAIATIAKLMETQKLRLDILSSRRFGAIAPTATTAKTTEAPTIGFISIAAGTPYQHGGMKLLRHRGGTRVEIRTVRAALVHPLFRRRRRATGMLP